MSRAIIFARNHRKKAALLIAGAALYVCVLSVLVQLIYPTNRALPGTRLAGKSVSFQNENQLKTALQRLGRQSFKLQLASKLYEVTPSEAGLTFSTKDNLATLVDYPVGQRLIPFSMFWRQRVVSNRLYVKANQTQLEIYAGKVASESYTQPGEGAIIVNNGQVSKRKPKAGRRFTAGEVAKKLQNLKGDTPTLITIGGQAVPPTIDDAAVQAAAERATDLIKPFTLTINGSSITVPAVTVGSWLTFTPDQASKQIDVGLNDGAIKNYLDGMAKRFYRAPTTTHVTLLDNHAASQQSGTPGSYLDTTARTKDLAAAIMGKTSGTTLTLSASAPSVSYIHTYSSTSAGLQALLNDWLTAHGGPKWGISLVELGGRNRRASYGAGSGFMSASIYKLYVSYSAQTRIASGKLNPNAATSTGHSVNYCLNVMIVNSDNACAIAVAEMIGWNTVTSDAHAAGFGSTNLNSGSVSSTPADTARFLEKLAGGSLMDGSQTSTLVNRLEHQIYRQGLPAGSTGAKVADKVGFYGPYLHDAGIVYYPGHTYVISVFSHDGSWSQVSNLASTIENYMSTH